MNPFVYRWSPVLVERRRWWLRLTLRIPRIAAVSLHASWKEWGDLHPHAMLGLDIGRLHAWVRLGGFWRDEDGDRSSLLSLGVDFSTYGIPNLACVALGHQPGKPMLGGGVYCERCHDTLVEPDYTRPRPPGGGLPTDRKTVSLRDWIDGPGIVLDEHGNQVEREDAA